MNGEATGCCYQNLCRTPYDLRHGTELVAKLETIGSTRACLFYGGRV